jgi:hypothetical protein
MESNDDLLNYEYYNSPKHYDQEWHNNMMTWDKLKLVDTIRDLRIQLMTAGSFCIRPCTDCPYNDYFKTPVEIEK